MTILETLAKNTTRDMYFTNQNECVSFLSSLGEFKEMQNPKMQNEGFVWKMLASSSHTTHWVLAVNQSDDPWNPEYIILCLARINHTLADANSWADMTAKECGIPHTMHFRDNSWS